MKKITLIVTLLLSLHSIAQYNGIIATYKLILSENKESKLDKMFFNSINELHNISDEFEFILKSNKTKSLFYLKNKLYTQESLAKYALTRSNYNGRHLQTLRNTYLEYNSELLKKAIVKSDKQKWNLINEKKTINNFECFKATTIYKVVNTAGVFESIVEAWYCPEINLPFGPIGYGGLPGLIVELKIKDAVYGLKNIQFLKEEKIEIEDLKDYAIITQEELNGEAKEIYENSIKQ